MSAAADVPPRSPSVRSSSSRAATPAAPRRQPIPARKPGTVRRLLRPALFLITLVLVADALVGENGWFEHQRERARLADKTAELAKLKAENARLEVRVKRLQDADPAIIEDLARGKLEMLKPGEVLFVDGTPGADASGSTRATAPTH
jgi:cell division protein FtsB